MSQVATQIRAVGYHVRKGNWTYLRPIVIKTVIRVRNVLLFPVGVVVALAIRALRPVALVRIDLLKSERLGHFAGDTEVYLNGRDAGVNVPPGRYVDIWYHNWPICNRQLARMWARVMTIGPAWLLAPADTANRLLPGWETHVINPPHDPNSDRDPQNLLDRFPAHLRFLSDEDRRGEAGLRKLGIAEGAPWVCLHVRDDRYLQDALPWWNWSYHDYRNCSISNYVLASEELVKRGYYVVRMGALVREPMPVSHPMIIDYSANGMRDDFMDIYLGAKCAFCISNGSGFDAVPFIFRRGIVYVDHVPLGIINTFSEKFVATTKKHWSRRDQRFMTLREIFASGAGVGMSNREDGHGIGVDLIESTPEEIAAVVLEMEERMRGVWQPTAEDADLQRRFWEIFQEAQEGLWAHGMRSNFGADFLRRHRDWLN
jgi:putative glycosyltransferase (TIGR04372 family)